MKRQSTGSLPSTNLWKSRKVCVTGSFNNRTKWWKSMFTTVSVKYLSRLATKITSSRWKRKSHFRATKISTSRWKRKAHFQNTGTMTILPRLNLKTEERPELFAKGNSTNLLSMPTYCRLVTFRMVHCAPNRTADNPAD